MFDEKINKLIPPRSVPSHLNILLSHMEAAEPGSQTNIAKALHHSAEGINKRGLVIVISDLMDDIHNTINGLRHLRHKGHEVIVFHILDNQEIEFDFKRGANFIDLETNDTITIDPRQIRKQYKQSMSLFCNEYKRNRAHRSVCSECPIHHRSYVP